MSQTPPDSRIAVYQANRAQSWLTVGVLGTLLTVGIVGLGTALASGAHVGLLLLFWVLVLGPAFGGRIYNELFRVANRLATDGQDLRGSGLRRRWAWHVKDIERVRRSRTNNGCVVIVNRSGERLMVRPQRGWSDFVALIAPDRADSAAGRLRWYEKGIGMPSALSWVGSWPNGL